MTDQLTQNSFLGDMQTVIRGQVESLTRYEIDGDNKGGSIWVSKPNTGKNPNNLGNELIKVKMPFEMFDQKKSRSRGRKTVFPLSNGNPLRNQHGWPKQSSPDSHQHET